MRTGKREGFTLRIGYTTVHPFVNGARFGNLSINENVIIGPKRSLDGKIQWKPDPHAIEGGFHFTLLGFFTQQATLSVIEKEKLVKIQDHANEERLQKQIQDNQ